MTCCGSNGTPFVQTRFMGASVVSFNASAGWNNTDGGLTIELVEDKCTDSTRLIFEDNGYSASSSEDNFNPPPVGSPCYFSFGGFTAGGILKNWRESDAAGDARKYTVSVGSVSDILGGVQCILQNYDGSVQGVHNLINVHGYLMNLTTPIDGSNCGLGAFSYDYASDGKGMASALPAYYEPAVGWAKVSEAGWRWYMIYNALVSILNGGGGRFGSMIRYRGHTYGIDLSELPILNNEIRLGGENKSLLEIIQHVCDLGGVTFFFDLIQYGPINMIKLRVGSSPWQAYDQSAQAVDIAVDSAIAARLGQGTIGRAIANSDCVNRYSRGLELRNTITNSFITGEYRQDMWQVAINETPACDGSDVIWPYWGKDEEGNVIFGSECMENEFVIEPGNETALNDVHHFTVNVEHLKIPVDEWVITVPQLRAAIIGESEWRSYIACFEPTQFRSLFTKAEHIVADDTGFIKMIMDGLDPAKGKPKLQAADVFDLWRGQNDTEFLEEYWIQSSRLYEYVKKFATEFYGRKFMVRIPICAGLNEDNPWVNDARFANSSALNWRESDSAWADGPVLGLPLDSDIIEFFRKEDGKIQGFMRFVSTSEETILLDKLNKGDFWVVSSHEVYVRCTVEDIVNVGPGDWRAVVTSSGPVRMDFREYAPPEWYLTYAMIEAKGNGLKLGKEAWHDFEQKVKDVAGAEKLALGAEYAFLMPVSVAVPLQSQKLVYGPWYASKGGVFSGFDNGGTSYDRSSEFAPWNFGSSSLMNLAATMTASARLGDKYVEESGDITVPGAPTGRLGQRMDVLGPMVSAIDVSVGRGDGEVTTTYRMKTWTPDFGKFAIARVEALRRSASIAQKAERLYRKFALEKSKERNDILANELISPKAYRAGRMTPHTSQDFFMGSSYDDPEDATWSRTHGCITEARSGFRSIFPNPNADDADGQYRDRAGVGFNGLFRPFSTAYQSFATANDDATCLPRYESCDPEAGPRPFLLNHDGGTAGTTNSDLAKHDYFYSHEQVPPIFCYEHHQYITVNTLSPFLGSGKALIANAGWEETGINMADGGSEGHDIEHIIRGSVYPTHLSVRQDDYDEEHWYRAIAHRGPLILAGWGYDIDNKPVPNSNPADWEQWTESNGPTNFFAQDWLRRPELWKCGPVDLRWDYRRKVWTAPTPFKLVRLQLKEWLFPGLEAGAVLYDDMVQFDENGKAIQTTEACAADYEAGIGFQWKGYHVSVFSNSWTAIPPGYSVIAYYDTTHSKYILLFHPKIPLLLGKMTKDMPCDSEVGEAEIIGVATEDADITGLDEIDSNNPLHTLDPCKAFKGLNARVVNPLKQSICKDRKIFIDVKEITHTKFDSSMTGSNPSIDACNGGAPTAATVIGSVVQAEFIAECFVTKIRLVEVINWCKRAINKEAKFTPTGKLSYYGGQPTTGTITDAPFKGTATVNKGSLTADLSGVKTAPKNSNILTLGEITITPPSTNIDVNGGYVSVDINHGHGMTCGSVSFQVDFPSYTGTADFTIPALYLEAAGGLTCETPTVTVTWPTYEIDTESVTVEGCDLTTSAESAACDIICYGYAACYISCPTHAHTLSGCGSVSLTGVTVSATGVSETFDVDGIELCTVDVIGYTTEVTGITASISAEPSGDGYQKITENVTGCKVTDLNDFERSASLQAAYINLKDETFTATVAPTYFDIPELDLNAAAKSVPITGTVPVTGTFSAENFPISLDINNVKFTGNECTLKLSFNDYSFFYKYKLCACSRQIFTQSSMGRLTCAENAAPACPSTCTISCNSNDRQMAYGDQNLPCTPPTVKEVPAPNVAVYPLEPTGNATLTITCPA